MFKRWISATLLAIASMHVSAADDAEKTVREAFKKIAPNANISEIRKSEVPGFYQLLVDANVYFVSDDGKYLIRGNVFDIPGRVDIGDKQLSTMRKATLAKITPDKELVFSPPNPKYTVTVFTDVDCPYCRQFHKQIAEYNKLGIAVNYVLFPLPMHKDADRKAQTVWCSADRNTTYTSAMNGEWDHMHMLEKEAKPVENSNGKPQAKVISADVIAAKADAPAYTPLTCANPIAEIDEIGKSMGVDGTPAIFGPDGEHLGGFVPPDQLAQRLEQSAARARPVAAN